MKIPILKKKTHISDSMPDGRSFEEAERELFGDLDEDDDHHGHGHRSPEGQLVSYQTHEAEKVNVLKFKPTQKSKKGRAERQVLR